MRRFQRRKARKIKGCRGLKFKKKCVIILTDKERNVTIFLQKFESCMTLTEDIDF